LAELSGFVVPNLIIYSITYETPRLYGYEWDASFVIYETTNTQMLPIFGQLVKGPLPPQQWQKDEEQGRHMYSCYQDVYGYVHFSDNYFNVGTLMADKTYSIELWNANLTDSVSLNSLGQVGTDGILFEGPLSYPYVFSPMEAQNYRFKVTTIGPPIIDATYSFNFNEYTIPIRFEGRRLVVFYWIPKNNFTEKLEWLTDLIETYNDEQRIALRIAPRRSITYNYIKTPDEASAIQTLTKAWVYRNWGVPIWVEATKIGSVSAGATTISFDTTNASYKDAAFIWENDNKNEALIITELRSNGIDLEQHVRNDYTNALIMPLHFGITPEGINFKQNYGSVEASTTFIIVDETYIGANPFGTYDGYAIIDKNVLVQDINQRVYRASTLIDNGQGLIEVEADRNIIDKTSILGKVTNTKADLWNWRKLLHSRRGKQYAFLLPTFQKDITIIETIWSGTSTAKIKGLGLSAFATFPIRTQLALTNGNTYNIKITSANPIPDSANETVTFDTSFGFDIKPEDIVRWSFIDLVRFDADSITLEYDGIVMKCAVPVKVVSA